MLGIPAMHEEWVCVYVEDHVSEFRERGCSEKR